MKRKNLFFNLLLVASVFLFAQACNPKGGSEQRDAVMSNEHTVSDVFNDEDNDVNKAVCVLHPTEGNDISGVVMFTKSDSGIVVVADIKGLTPGEHGFHVHQYGDCSGSDGTSAGGHFNPGNTEHGAPEDDMRHVGDFGNLVADENGNAHYEMVDHEIRFRGKNSIIGRSLIVHAGEDDLKSQPSGASGARVACGVIGIAKNE